MNEIEKLIKNLTWFDLIRQLKKILRLLNIGSQGTAGRLIRDVPEDIYNIPSGTGTSILTFTGSDTTAILPAVEGSEGAILFLIAAGGEVGIETHDNSERIWEGGLQVSSTSIPMGTIMRIVNNAQSWVVL